MNTQRLKFAEMKKSHNLVNVSASQHDRGDWGITRRAPGLELRIGDDLRAEVRRRVDQAPRAAARTNGNLRLRACMSVKISCAQAGTTRTRAVPLRKAAPGCR